MSHSVRVTREQAVLRAAAPTARRDRLLEPPDIDRALHVAQPLGLSSTELGRAEQRSTGKSRQRRCPWRCLRVRLRSVPNRLAYVPAEQSRRVESTVSESTRGRSPVLVRYPSRRGRTSSDAMSRAFAQWKVQEVLVATYTPPFIEALRVDVLQRPIELTALLGKVHSARRAAPVRFTVDCGRSALG